MSRQPQYKRVLVKVSGEGLCDAGGSGIDAGALGSLADEFLPLVHLGVQVAVVVGGGNVVRGRDLADNPRIRRTTADAMGMLSTVINALALRDALIGSGVAAVALGATEMPPFCERFTTAGAIEHLEAGRVVVLAGGTGNPFFTTDTCAALRALEIEAEVVLKATKVDGVYDSDPVSNPDAKRYDRLTYEKVLGDRLGVMDLTAISMCRENGLPIVVFQLSKAGNLAAAVCGEDVGTTVCR